MIKNKLFWNNASDIRESIDIKNLTDEKILKALKKKKDAPKGRLRDFYGGNNNTCVVTNIFKMFMLKTLEKVIEGDAFVFPLKTEPCIYAKAMDQEIVKKVRQLGLFKHIDILGTNFNIYELKYSFGPYFPRNDYSILIPKNLYKRFVDNQNNGQVFTKQIKYKYAPKSRGYTPRSI